MIHLATAASTATVAATVAGRAFRADVPSLFYAEGGTIDRTLLARLPSLHRGYRPPMLVPFGLIQSALADAWQPDRTETPFRRELESRPMPN